MDYQDLQDTAMEMIAEFGQPAVLTQRNVGTYDPTASPTVAGSGSTPFNVNLAVIPIDDEYIDGKKYEWNDEYDSGTAVTEEEAKAFMTPLSSDSLALAPKMDDVITTSDGDVYTIQKVSKIKPSTTILLYVLVLRK